MSLTKKEIVVEAVSKKTYGIKADDKWINLFEGLNDESVDKVVAMVNEINKGDKISLEVDESNKYYSITMIEKGKGSFGEETNFAALLNDAHTKHNLESIKTEMISVDWEKKTAIFKATVIGFKKTERTDTNEPFKTEGFDNVIFEAYGDATQENIDSEKVQKHWIRMAETRAIARALRWFTNNAKVAEEETDKGSIPGEMTEVDEKGQSQLVQTNDEIEKDKKQ